MLFDKEGVESTQDESDSTDTFVRVEIAVRFNYSAISRFDYSKLE